MRTPPNKSSNFYALTYTSLSKTGKSAYTKFLCTPTLHLMYSYSCTHTHTHTHTHKPVTLYSSSSNWSSCAHSAMISWRMKKGVCTGEKPRRCPNWRAKVMRACTHKVKMQPIFKEGQRPKKRECACTGEKPRRCLTWRAKVMRACTHNVQMLPIFKEGQKKGSVRARERSHAGA